MSINKFLHTVALASVATVATFTICTVAVPVASAAPVAGAERWDVTVEAARTAVSHLESVLDTAEADSSQLAYSSAFADLLEARLVVRLTLHDMAEEVAASAGRPGDTELVGRLYNAWMSVSLTRVSALLTALDQVGVRYQFGAADPNVGFDCSGLIRYAYLSVGISLPHSSTALASTLAPTVWPSAGDLAWYPGHIMLHLGTDDLVVHASRRGVPVRVAQADRIDRLVAPPAGDADDREV
jgi:peptidoglycan DL-endopeptidase CwlO